MEERTTADPVVLADFERRASSIADELMAMLTKLANDLVPLEAWVGRGGVAFQATSQVVRDQTRVMNEALRAIGVDAGVVGETTVVADEEQASAMKTISAAADNIRKTL